MWIISLLNFLKGLYSQRREKHLEALREATQSLSPEKLHTALWEMKSSVLSWRGPSGETLLQWMFVEIDTADKKSLFWLEYFMNNYLLRMDALLVTRSEGRESALHTAVVHAHSDSVRQIVAFCPKLLLRTNGNGHLPLTLALQLKSLKTVQLLLEHENHAQLQLPFKDLKMSVAEYAFLCNWPELIEWLLSRGKALVSPRNSYLLDLYSRLVVQEAQGLYYRHEYCVLSGLLDTYITSVLVPVILGYAQPFSFKDCAPYFIFNQ